jgi:hypothetical protein
MGGFLGLAPGVSPPRTPVEYFKRRKTSTVGAAGG